MQKYQNFDLYLKLTEETAKLLSNNQKVLESISSKSADYTIETLLDGMKTTDADFNVIGIYLYGLNGTKYSSSNVSDLPDFNDLVKDMSLDSFVDSQQESIWGVRIKNIDETIKIYIANYKPDYGMFTYVSKIYSGKRSLLGYIVINVDINKLYKTFSPKSNDIFDKSSCYIIQNGQLLPYPPGSKKLNTNMEKFLKNFDYTKTVKYKNNLLLCNKLHNSVNTYVVTLLPMNPIHNKFRDFTIMLVAVSMLFIGIVIYISKILSLSITLPLSQLHQKMQHPLSKLDE